VALTAEEKSLVEDLRDEAFWAERAGYLNLVKLLRRAADVIEGPRAEGACASAEPVPCSPS
jgi:hypothetical protein